MFTVYGLVFFLLLSKKIMTCGHFDWDKIKHNNFTDSGMIWSQNHTTQPSGTKTFLGQNKSKYSSERIFTQVTLPQSKHYRM